MSRDVARFGTAWCGEKCDDVGNLRPPISGKGVTTPHDYLSLIAPLTEGEHIVEAVQASAKECELLQIHAPWLLIRRRTWSTTHIVSHARLLFPGSRYRLQGHFAS